MAGWFFIWQKCLYKTSYCEHLGTWSILPQEINTCSIDRDQLGSGQWKIAVDILRVKWPNPEHICYSLFKIQSTDMMVGTEIPQKQKICSLKRNQSK